jgi:hypothetical protein
MAINVRNKGANGEREVCDLLQPVVDRVAAEHGLVAPRLRRNVEACQVGGEDIVGLPWYSIEVKRVERIELDKWWRQACVQATRRSAGSTSWDALARGGWRVVEAGGQSARPSGAGEAARGSCGREGGGSEVPRGEGQGMAGGPVAGQVVASVGGPLGVWAFGRGLVVGASREAPREVFVPSVVGRVDRRLDRLERASGGDREPVLIWRQNRQPWSVRCRANIVAGVDTLCIDVDMPLDAWIGVLARELGVRLSG